MYIDKWSTIKPLVWRAETGLWAVVWEDPAGGV